MAQRDYLLRMIEQIGQILIALRKLIIGGVDRQTADAGLQKAGQQVGVDLTLARAATAETLQMLIAPEGDLEPGRCWIVAEMMYLDGLQSEADGDPEAAADRFEKALLLYQAIAPMGAFLVGFPEASERVEDIRGRLESS